MIICPACGSNVEGYLRLGCPSCGARAVGPPLAKAEHELRSYGRALGGAATGVLMFAAFLGAVVAALVQYKPASQSFLILLRTSTIVAAGEVAAWRVKWFAFPAVIVALWGGHWLNGTIKRSASRSGGLRLARAGWAVSAVVTISIATLIGVTIPERLRQRQDSIEATMKARAYTLYRAALEYRELKGTYPADLRELGDKNLLPDLDGSIAEALSHVDPNGYQPSTVVAAASTKAKALVPRGGALRNAPANTNSDSPGVSFTNYELRLPSDHKLFGSDDDFIMKDGLIMKASEWSSSASSRKP